MTEIRNIMSTNPIFLSQHANVNRARKLMAEKKIRHIPIKDTTSGKLVGVLGQKAILTNALNIINTKGLDSLEYREKSTDVGSLMNTEFCAFEATASVQLVADSLLKLRNGCIIIEENNHLVGIVTSSDFVKLVAKQETL